MPRDIPGYGAMYSTAESRRKGALMVQSNMLRIGRCVEREETADADWRGSLWF
jgi:hypothetical protein